MDERIVPSDAEFWTRARRHLLKYGGEFVDFVPVRAEGAFLYDDAGQRVLVDLAEALAGLVPLMFARGSKQPSVTSATLG
jgi:hypothetical protein